MIHCRIMIADSKQMVLDMLAGWYEFTAENAGNQTYPQAYCEQVHKLYQNASEALFEGNDPMSVKEFLSSHVLELFEETPEDAPAHFSADQQVMR